MVSKSKEKNKKKNTKEKDLLDLDNEIIIGIKTLPEPQKSKRKKVANKKESGKNTINKKGKKASSSVNNKKKTRKKPKISNKENRTSYLKPPSREKNKKRKIIFRFIKLTTLILLVIGGSIYFLLSPYFNIKSITTSGNEKISSEELISLSGIQLEENMFRISSSKVEQAIKANAYIESVKVKRKLPDNIELQVTEREPAYMLMLGNAYVYINTQGYLLEISTDAMENPIITGFLTPEDQIQEGNRLCVEDLERLNSVIQIMDYANNNEIGNLVTKINIADKQDYVLELKSEKKIVYLGDTTNLSTKMLYIKTVIEKEKDKEGEIFVNTDLSNKGAIFREKV